MKQKDFDRLVASVKEAGAIRRGELKPSRVTDFDPEDVRAIRVQLKKSQEEFAFNDRRQCSHTSELGARTATTGGPGRALLRALRKIHELLPGHWPLDVGSLFWLPRSTLAERYGHQVIHLANLKHLYPRFVTLVIREAKRRQEYVAPQYTPGHG